MLRRKIVTLICDEIKGGWSKLIFSCNTFSRRSIMVFGFPLLLDTLCTRAFSKHTNIFYSTFLQPKFAMKLQRKKLSWGFLTGFLLWYSVFRFYYTHCIHVYFKTYESIIQSRYNNICINRYDASRVHRVWRHSSRCTPHPSTL